MVCGRYNSKSNFSVVMHTSAEEFGRDRVAKGCGLILGLVRLLLLFVGLSV